jgi:hypothetical protein
MPSGLTTDWKMVDHGAGGAGPVLMIYGKVGEPISKQWNVSSLFVSSCPMGEEGSCYLQEFRISKVVESETEFIQTKSWVAGKFKISSDGMFKVLDFNSTYTAQKIYVQPKNSKIWST